MKIRTSDALLLQRYVDGELGPAAAAEFARRLDADPALRREAEALRGMAAGFAAARGPAQRAPAGFAAAVLAGVRQLPDRVQLEAAETAAQVLRICRRMLLAAVLLSGVALAVQAGLFDGDLGEPLQAAPDEIDAEIRRLDALLKAGLTKSGAAESAAEPVRR